MTFQNWIKTFLAEKGISSDAIVEANGPSGVNYIPVGVLVGLMLQAPKHEQQGIKSMMVRIDFANKPVMPYLAHLAQAVAV